MLLRGQLRTTSQDSMQCTEATGPLAFTGRPVLGPSILQSTVCRVMKAVSSARGPDTQRTVPGILVHWVAAGPEGLTTCPAR